MLQNSTSKFSKTNDDSVLKCVNIQCPFSNHNFVIKSLNVKTITLTNQYIKSRVVNHRNLNLIKEELAVTKFDIINSFYDINEKLHVNKRMLLD